MKGQLFRDIAARKDFSGGITPYGDHLLYTDPAAAVDRGAVGSPITWFVISDESIDRDGDCVRSTGWDIADFLKNGAPWLYDHGEIDSRPIGRAVHPETGEPLIRFEPGRVLAGVAWDDDGEWGREVHGLVERGLVSTASLGFIPTRGKPRPKSPGLGGGRKNAWEIQELSVLEFSLTPTPANTNALRLAIDRGELSPVIVKSFRKALGTLGDAAGGALVGTKEDDKGTDEHATFKAELDDCVSRKMKILMDEGKDQRQALAIAYSMCGEKALQGDGTTQDEPGKGEVMEKDKSANCNGKAVGAKTKAMDATDDTADTAVAEETPAEETPEREPHGAATSRAILEHIQALLEYLGGELPVMDQEDLKAHLEDELLPVLQECAAGLHDTASEIYPDIDLGERPEPVPDDGDEGEEEEVDEAPDADDDTEEKSEDGEDDSEADDGDGEEEKSESDDGDDNGMTDKEEKEEADKYVRRHTSRYLRKHYARKASRMRKDVAASCMKGCETMHKAADHLDESSEDAGIEEHKGYLHKGHAAALRKSAADVSRAVSGHEEGGEKEDMPDAGPGGGSGGNQPVVDKAVSWDDVLREAAAVRKSLNAARGR